jgi:cytochrome d ubiquinol oxidase subunit I
MAMVAIGTTLSNFWIVTLNAWMHTPSGFHMENGKAVIDSWWEVIFNPSQPYRQSHTILSSLLTASFLVAGVSAWRLLKYRKDVITKDMLVLALHIAAVAAPLQIISGHAHGINSLLYHPETVAAMEGLWDTQAGAPLVLFATIDTVARKNFNSIEIPYGSSLVLTNDPMGVVRGLNDFPEHPPVVPVFWGFRIMVGTGIMMLLVSWLGSIHLWRNTFPKKWFLCLATLMTFSGWLGTLAGWYTTEIGRQPYLVYGVLKTADATANVSANVIQSSLTMYLLLYGFLLIAYVSTVAYLARKDPECLV